MQLGKNSSHTEESVMIKMLRKTGGSMSSIAQELIFEAKSKVDEQNFDMTKLVVQNFDRCQEECKEIHGF